MKLPKGLVHPKKDLINTQNIDYNECFKWKSVRYLILQTLIQKDLQQQTNILQKDLILKT